MYRQIIDELNHFLSFINIPGTPLNPDVFQGVLIKKLSNQNIIKDKRRINAGDTISTVNQTHIDITGRQGILFFFEELNNATTVPKSIDIDLFDNNLVFLRENDNIAFQLDRVGNTCSKRKPLIVPPYITDWDLMRHSSAYKKYGHTGNQVQINIPDPEEAFTQLQRYAFQDDALVMLRYDYFRYVAILIPYELCGKLYSITNTYGNHNVNYVALNSTYAATLAHQIQHEIVSKDVLYDEISSNTLQTILNNSPAAGTDVDKIVKTRVSQGSFRRLLLLERHQCNLCNITTTSVLRASHIKGWADSSREERIDANNGLLLCANHDALFDRHLISFHPQTGRICISSSLSTEQFISLNLDPHFILPMSNETKKYMQIHYEKFLEKESK